MKWFLHPRRDNQYRWWWGYQRVRINVLDESEKKRFLRKHEKAMENMGQGAG